jgi:hypothetical protein
MGAKQRVTLGPSSVAVIRLVVPPELLNQEVDVVLLPTHTRPSSGAGRQLKDFASELHLDFSGYRFDRDEIHDEHDRD